MSWTRINLAVGNTEKLPYFIYLHNNKGGKDDFSANQNRDYLEINITPCTTADNGQSADSKRKYPVTTKEGKNMFERLIIVAIAAAVERAVENATKD